ncbi:MAG: hypothetical protein ABFC34_08120 [Methanobacterium sp.]
MNIPKTIQIAGIEYKIEKVPFDSPQLNGGAYTGIHAYKEATIYIREDLKGDVLGQVFCHELVHAIFSGMGVDQGEDAPDEVTVESFSQLMFQAIKQL